MSINSSVWGRLIRCKNETEISECGASLGSTGGYAVAFAIGSPQAVHCPERTPIIHDYRAYRNNPSACPSGTVRMGGPAKVELCKRDTIATAARHGLIRHVWDRD